MAVSELLGDLLAPVEAKLGAARDAVEARAADTEAARERERSARDDLRTLERLREQITGEKPDRPKAGKAKAPVVGPDRLKAVADFVTANGEAGVTSREVADALGVSNISGINAALRTLRDQEVIRKAGTRQTERGIPPAIYKPMPNGNGDHVTEGATS